MDENKLQQNEKEQQQQQQQQQSSTIKVLKIDPSPIEHEASGGEDDFYGYDGDNGDTNSRSSSSSSIGAVNDSFIRTLINKPTNIDGGRGERKSEKGITKRAESVKDDDADADACSECSSTHMSDELVLKGCMYTILNRFLSTDSDKHGPQTVAKSLERIATALEAIQRSLEQDKEHDKETTIHHAR